jgi:hypothetical protein
VGQPLPCSTLRVAIGAAAIAAVDPIHGAEPDAPLAEILQRYACPGQDEPNG